MIRLLKTLLLIFIFGALTYGCGSSTTQKSIIASDESASAVYSWFTNCQQDNGLVPSCEGDDNPYSISLYDQSLSAMVFTIMGDYARAEKILDFFNNRVDSEFLQGGGGFWMFRYKNGSPSNVSPGKWLGDNAYLLAAICNYQKLSGNTNKYTNMLRELEIWITNLQDTDGGVLSGYDENENLRTDKITEGNIDAFGVLPGYTDFHKNILSFLSNDRWDVTDRMLISWAGTQWKYAQDNVSWAYCAIEGFPESTFVKAETFFAVTKTATANNVESRGFCFDADKDTIHPEATMSMAVAYQTAGQFDKAAYYIKESEKILLPGINNPDTKGLPYASNPGTTYGPVVLWSTACDRPYVSPSAWYIFSKIKFNPFGFNRSRGIPADDRFWDY